MERTRGRSLARHEPRVRRGLAVGERNRRRAIMHDERLAKIIALWRSTQHDGERQAARAKGKRLAKQLGMSFEDAVVADDVHHHPRNGDIFAGFDDFMEAKEPGYKAAAAREKAEKIAAREARRKAIIERYGSAEAALAPCERELMLQKAVERWRKPCNPPHERWTHSVDGWCFYSEAPPERVETALRNAYPLPETFPVARAEYDLLARPRPRDGRRAQRRRRRLRPRPPRGGAHDDRRGADRDGTRREDARRFAGAVQALSGA